MGTYRLGGLPWIDSFEGLRRGVPSRRCREASPPKGAQRVCTLQIIDTLDPFVFRVVSSRRLTKNTYWDTCGVCRGREGYGLCGARKHITF